MFFIYQTVSTYNLIKVHWNLNQSFASCKTFVKPHYICANEIKDNKKFPCQLINPLCNQVISGGGGKKNKEKPNFFFN